MAMERTALEAGGERERETAVSCAQRSLLTVGPTKPPAQWVKCCGWSRHQGILETGGTAPLILYLGTR